MEMQQKSASFSEVSLLLERYVEAAGGLPEAPSKIILRTHMAYMRRYSQEAVAPSWDSILSRHCPALLRDRCPSVFLSFSKPPVSCTVAHLEGWSKLDA